MDIRTLVLRPTPLYNSFLFAPVCEDANGTPLSVLSALTRLNIDPWEEATRLSSMPEATAQRKLVSTLGQVPGKSWKTSDAEAIAARLVRLLPQREHATVAATGTGRGSAQRTSYWLVWLGFAVLISILSPRHHATTDTGVSTATSNDTSQVGKQ